jgi:GT2 family glycosyltransferase
MIGSAIFDGEFAYGFDDPIEAVSYTRALRISGWLVNTQARPIHGIRVIACHGFWPGRVVRARRKRSRPDVAAEFQGVPGAGASGFLIEMRLHSGRNEISMQVQDERKCWRTFFHTRIRVFPLDLLTTFGLPNVRDCFAAKLRRDRLAGSIQLVARDQSAIIPTAPAEFSTKRVVIYGTSRSNLFIREVGELVVAGFAELGCNAALVFDQLPEPENDDALQIVLTPHEYYNLFLLEQVPRKTARELTRNVVLLCTEQPATSWFNQNLRWACDARAVADINPLGVESYRAHGIRAHHLALGFHQLLSHPHEKPNAARDIEITFLGSLTDRRDRFFARHTNFFSQRDCHLRFVPLGFAKTESSRSYMPAAERNALLSNSKILLNIHYSDRQYFEWHRMLLGLANGCCIITENCAGYAPLIPNEHFIMVDSDALIDACRYYLERPEECARIAAAGAQFVRTKLRQAAGCYAFLRELELDDRNIPNLARLTDPLPMALPPKLKKKLAGENFWAALRADLRKLDARSSSDVRVKSPAAPAPQEPERIGKEVAEKRDGYRRRRREQEARLRGGEQVWTIHDNIEFGRSAAPQISVVITLYNYGSFIEGCVNSIERAANSLMVPIEVVIIDDASTDDSCAVVRRIQKRLTFPVRLVQKRFNTGLVDARNIGTQIARAPYIFMMDADNLVMPRALSLLLETMERGHYAATYSILCRFLGRPDHPVGLLSYYDWDPEILVQAPYVDAMGMFRRDALLEVGGYDHTLSEIGWFGWEDYDMWLRFAQHDMPVGFVPNILCLYRHHETSMINTTNLFAAKIVALFQQRYQSLASRFVPRDTLFGIARNKLANPQWIPDPKSRIQ